MTKPSILLSKKTIQDYHWQEVQKLLKRVFKNNEFYKEKYKKAGFTKASQIKSLKDVSKLPFCTKAELMADQEAYPPFGKNSNPNTTYYVKPTTGTSGFNFFVPNSAADMERRNLAGKEMHHLTMPPKKGDRGMFVMTGSAFAYMNDQFLRAEVHSYPPDEFRNIGSVQRVVNKKIELIYMSTTKLLRFLETAQENNINLKESNIQKILCGGEPGGGIQSFKKAVKKLTGKRCYWSAGSTEMGMIGQECEYDPKNPHLFENSTYIEVIDPETGKASDKGEMVITSIYRHDYPLIRYRTGDYVEVFREKCKCGMETLKIKNANFIRYSSIYTFGKKLISVIDIESIIRKNIGLSEFSMGFYGAEKNSAKAKIIMQLEQKNPQENLSAIKKLKKELEKKFENKVDIYLIPYGSIDRINVKTYRITDYRGKTIKPVKPYYGLNIVGNLLTACKNIFSKLKLRKFAIISAEINEV